MCPVDTAVQMFWSAQNHQHVVGIDQPKQLWQPVKSDHMLGILYDTHLYSVCDAFVSVVCTISWVMGYG